MESYVSPFLCSSFGDLKIPKYAKGRASLGPIFERYDT